MKNNRLNSKSRVHTFSREKSSIFIVHFGSNKYKIFAVTKAYGYGHFFLLPFFQDTEREMMAKTTLSLEYGLLRWL